MTSGRFALQWVNDNGRFYLRPMGSAVFTLRDALSVDTGEGGLTCGRLHLDQVVIHFRPTTDIGSGEFRPGDSSEYDWRAETQLLYVRTTPGARHTLYTDGVPSRTDINQGVDGTTGTGRAAQRSLVYTTSLTPVPYTGLVAEDPWCRTYRPVRDLPILQHVANLSEIQLDLFWPLLQGDPGTAWWQVPDYRILRVVCEFSYTS